MSYASGWSAGLDPGRRRRHRMTRSLRAEVLGRLLEVEQLRVVEVRAELLVDREQPPVGRQLDREVRPALLRSASRRCGRPCAGRTAAGTRSGRRTSRGCPAARTAWAAARPAAAPAAPRGTGPCTGPRTPRRSPSGRPGRRPSPGPGRAAAAAPSTLQLRLRQQVGDRVGRVEPVARGRRRSRATARRPCRAARSTSAGRAFCSSRLSRYAPNSIASSVRRPVLSSSNGASQRHRPRGVNPSSCGSRLIGRRRTVGLGLGGAGRGRPGLAGRPSRASGSSRSAVQRSRLSQRICVVRSGRPAG